jgi:hypothetical protein
MLKKPTDLRHYCKQYVQYELCRMSSCVCRRDAKPARLCTLLLCMVSMLTGLLSSGYLVQKLNNFDPGFEFKTVRYTSNLDILLHMKRCCTLAASPYTTHYEYAAFCSRRYYIIAT